MSAYYNEINSFAAPSRQAKGDDVNTDTNDTLVLAGRESAEWLRAEQHFGAADLMIEMADAIMTLRTALAAANERAESLQRTINEARSQSPAATIVEIDDGLGTTFLEFHEPRGPAGTNYYAAPVLSQPAVVPEEVRKMRETLFDISTSDVLSDRSENTHVTVAIDRDTFRQAAILSTTEGLKDGG